MTKLYLETEKFKEVLKLLRKKKNKYGERQQDMFVDIEEMDDYENQLEPIEYTSSMS